MRVATFESFADVFELKMHFIMTSREVKSHGKLRVERYHNGIRWGCSCQSYIPPGFTVPCIPMVNGPVPISCPECGALQ